MVREDKLGVTTESRGPGAPAALRATSVVLGLASLLLVGGVLGGASIPFISDDRTALLVLAFIGLAMCAAGPLSQIGATGKWLSPGAIFGILMGVVALGLVGGVVAGARLPFVANDRDAFIALAAIMLIKAAAGVLYRFRA